ncbi:antibiotic biosynthesis monooxygenase [Streptomyces sp. N35]|uniref:antibiotic biosynthesis monooxygenase n=1 Tax=Streptomyces sp. N35 TaxID=2795730 RepID=UPI0018F5B99C|nr:antibiotic biosynthesis monooxygenase [Streptomyces sp. N35]
MTLRIDTVPDLDRPGVGAVLASTWNVGTPERQDAAVAAITKTWESRPWPVDGPVSYSVFKGTDGESLLHLSQWRELSDYDAFVARHRTERNSEIDDAVPGIQRLRLDTYELYRGASRDPDRAPGAIVTVEVEFDGPDPARQRAWIDAVFEALGSEPTPHPGGISGHFHTSFDGTKVLNFAQWASVQDHVDALAAPGNGVGSPTPQWQRVHSFPGVVGGGVRRWLPAVSLSAG